MKTLSKQRINIQEVKRKNHPCVKKQTHESPKRRGATPNPEKKSTPAPILKTEEEKNENSNVNIAQPKWGDEG